MSNLILVADDTDWSAVTLEVLVETLPDFQVVRAANGQEACKLMDSHPVSAIITDLNMPRMDGFAFIERVRERSAASRIPIIVVSADDTPEARDKARQLGANAFFVKPFSPAAVRVTLEELMQACSSGAAPLSPSAR